MQNTIVRKGVVRTLLGEGFSDAKRKWSRQMSPLSMLTFWHGEATLESTEVVSHNANAFSNRDKPFVDSHKDGFFFFF